MNGFARRVSALTAVLTGCCLLAAPAGATEFCVQPAGGCGGGQKPTIQEALDAALASPGHDTVRLPAGTVFGPGSYDSANPDNPVSVVGAGRDATIVMSVTFTASGYSLDLRNGATLSDLTLKQSVPTAPGEEALRLVGTMDRVGLSSSSANGGRTLIIGTARHVSANGPSHIDIRGTLEDSEIIGGTLYTGNGDSIIRRLRMIAPVGPDGQNSSLVLSSSLIVSTDPSGYLGSWSANTASNEHVTLVLSNDTFIGGGAGCSGIYVSGENGGAPPPNDASVMNATIANTIVRNCGATLVRQSGGGNRIANVSVFSSDIDLSPAAVTQTGAGTLTAGPGDGNINVDPLFTGLNGFDQELRFSSPAIDKGLKNLVSPEESETDLNGNSRVVDGNGDGVIQRDIGAFEYQRSPPAVRVSASAMTAATGQVVTFKGSAIETTDPGETVTGLAWRFDDGAVATGADATHGFSTPGEHSATLTATDSAGVTGAATAWVTVVAAPVAPAVTSLSLSPASFRAAAKGASTAAKKKKRPPVGTTVKLGLSSAAAVKLRVRRRTTGRRSGTSCVVATRRNRRAKACTRTVTLPGSITRAAGAPVQFRFTGRLSGRALAPGSYLLLARAGSTPEKAKAFKIVR